MAAYLNGRDETTAVRAALAIGRTKRAAGVPLLEAHLDASDAALRAMCVYGLGLIGEPASAGSLVRMLSHDRSDVVRAAALDAVDRFEAARTLDARVEKRAVHETAALLRAASNPIVRGRAAITLESFARGPQAAFAAGALARAFPRELDASVRMRIMWSISRSYATRVARAVILAGLKDRDETVRIQAARALGRTKDVAEVAELKPLLADPSWRVQEQTVQAIRALRGQPPTAHLHVIAAGVHVPPVGFDRLDRVAALPRTRTAGKPSRPTAANAIFVPSLDASTLRGFTGPAPGPHPRVRIVTTKGNIYLVLYPEWAPLTVENFLNLANRGYFDNNRWFRIVPDFVAQTGDKTNTGNGDAGYTIPNEENPIEQDSYVISMGLNYTNPPNAHAIRDSAGTQFYITLSPQFHLDRDFTVFGRVIAGFDVLGRLVESDSIRRVDRLPDAP